jgi:16S rRNA (adenine1518-N6/adenine1519-N6)-dimethyltransferase
VTASSLASPSATIAVLERHGLYTKKSLGQHFLVDDNVVARILGLAALDENDVVVEVGPGIGTLTLALCERAAVVAVERDLALGPVLAETTADCSRFEVVHADAVTVNAETIAAPFGPPTALVANLPYQVAATVVLRFFELIPSLSQATVMVQAEVADRMAASPGSKEYGAYTVKLRLFAEPAGRFNVAPGCFLPPPRVDSAVIRLERRDVLADEQLRRDVIRVVEAAFAQRRKTVRNSLKAVLAQSPAEIDTALEAAGIDGRRRAETLSVAEFVTLGSSLSPAR